MSKLNLLINSWFLFNMPLTWKNIDIFVINCQLRWLVVKHWYFPRFLLMEVHPNFLALSNFSVRLFEYLSLNPQYPSSTFRLYRSPTLELGFIAFPAFVQLMQSPPKTIVSITRSTSLKDSTIEYNSKYRIDFDTFSNKYSTYHSQNFQSIGSRNSAKQ